MNSDLSDLSESDLKSMIESAQKALREKQDAKRKEVVAKIKELAASIGAQVELTEAPRPTGRKGIKVPIKYRDPDDPSHQWSGRGVKPKWLQAFLDQGRRLEEFEV